MQKKRLSKEEALQKLRHYCAYQERCHKEVKEKLYGYGLYKTDVDDAIATLIEENYLNEERFAAAYAGGHFRSKQWGRVKISYELKQKGVSEYCIRKAMKEIDEEDYTEAIRNIALKKARSLNDEPKPYIKQQKIAAYLVQRGFELPLVQQLVREVMQQECE